MVITSVKEAFEAVKLTPFNLQYIPDEFQTEEVCIQAVKTEGWALPFVKNQTPEICLAAVKKSGYALRCVNNQTEELCIQAVRTNGLSLQFVENQTEEICLAAVKHDVRSLKYVKRPTLRMYAIAYLEIKDTHKLFKEPLTPELLYQLIEIEGLILKHVPKSKQTKKLCLAAVRQNGLALQYIHKPTKEITLEAIKQNPDAIKFAKPWS